MTSSVWASSRRPSPRTLPSPYLTSCSNPRKATSSRTNPSISTARRRPPRRFTSSATASGCIRKTTPWRSEWTKTQVSEVWQTHTRIHTEIYWKCSRERMGSAGTRKNGQETRGKSVKGLFDFFSVEFMTFEKKKENIGYRRHLWLLSAFSCQLTHGRTEITKKKKTRPQRAAPASTWMVIKSNKDSYDKKKCQSNRWSGWKQLTI